MARIVRTEYRKMPSELHDALKNTKNMSSNRALDYLEKRKIKPLVSRGSLNKIISSSRSKNGIPIKISKDMTKGYRYADGVTITKGNKVNIRIHPMVQYQGKRYVKDIIGHELDHAKVEKKIISRRKKK
jgi:hypothetical protein